jgi:hypothetical protein
MFFVRDGAKFYASFVVKGGSNLTSYSVVNKHVRCSVENHKYENAFEIYNEKVGALPS